MDTQWEDISSIPLTQSDPLYGATQGALEFAGNGYVSGWAVDTSDLTKPATVEIWVNGEYNGTTTANISRPGLSFLNCTGNVGFEYFPVNLPEKEKGWDIQAYVLDEPVGNKVQLLCVGDCYLERETIPQKDAIGAVEVIRQDLISGWAFDPYHPEPEILVFLDKRLVGVTVANLERPGLSFLDGTGRHGFAINPINMGKKKGKVEVYVSDAPFAFRKTIDWFGEDKVKKPKLYRKLSWVGQGSNKLLPVEPGAFGFVERADAGWVTGWVFDPGVSESAYVKLEIDKKIESYAQASVPRPALAEIFGRAPSFGFGFEVPVVDTGKAKDAKLKAYVFDTKTGLEIPLTFLKGVKDKIDLPNKNVLGEMEVVTQDVISGWVYDPEMESTGAQVVLYGPNGDELGSTMANIDRPDLAWVNGSGNKLGFQIVPERIGASGSVDVRIVVKDRPTGDLLELEAPPMTVSSPEAYGALEFSDCDSLYGWAYDPRLGETPVVVEIFVDGLSLGKTIADLPRPGLTWLQGTDHGFGFWMPDILTEGVHDVTVVYTDQRTGLEVVLPTINNAEQIDCEAREFPPLVCE